MEVGVRHYQVYKVNNSSMVGWFEQKQKNVIRLFCYSIDKHLQVMELADQRHQGN